MAGEDECIAHPSRLGCNTFKGSDRKIEERKHADVMKKAYSAILLNLGDEVLREVTKEKSAKVVWDKLEDL